MAVSCCGAALTVILSIERARWVVESPVSERRRIHDHKTGIERCQGVDYARISEDFPVVLMRAAVEQTQPTAGNPDALLFPFGGYGTAVGERH
jgi:hypothetical protein